MTLQRGGNIRFCQVFQKTGMHSSRIRTIRYSGRLIGGRGGGVCLGCVCPGGVCPRGGGVCPGRVPAQEEVSTQGGVHPRGCLAGGCLAGGCVSRGVCLGGVSAQGRCLSRGSVCLGGVCPGGDLPIHINIVNILIWWMVWEDLPRPSKI